MGQEANVNGRGGEKGELWPFLRSDVNQISKWRC